jgi:replicative DNA helicase
MSTSKNGNKNRKKLYEPSPSEIGKLQPQAIELEEAVLGALLLDSESLDTISKDLSDDLFYKEQNQLISNAILNLYRKNDRVDILTVSQELKRLGQLEMVGGSFYVSSLTNRIASSANIEYHVKILQQHSLKRSAIRFCTNAIKKAYDDSEDVFEMYAELQMDADNSIKDVMHYEVSSISKIHQKNMDESREIAENGSKSGVESGLELVDDITSGWQKTDLIILAGRPSMGKTACAISMIIHPSIEKDVPVAIFSLEMSNAQLGGRIESYLSGIDVGKIIKKQLDLGDVSYIEKACEKLKTAPLYIDDTPNISLTELKSKARRLHREKGIKLIVIDYLQLMRSGLNIQNREQEIAEISKGLKALAKELDIPIIALSQLSRSVEGRTDKKPQLSDLRESGQIEQDADMVMFCYRPEYYGGEVYELEGQEIDAKGLFVLVIAKNRNGELCDVPLRFIGQLAKITNHPNYRSPNRRRVEPVDDTPSYMGTNLAQNNDFLSQSNEHQKREDDEKDDNDGLDLPF